MEAQHAERNDPVMKHNLGLVIGKFYPPHRGHKLLIDSAVAQSTQAVVIVCAKPTDRIPGGLRGQWLQEIHPTARVMVIDDRYDENDSRVWAANTIRWLGRAPDAVFTSEDYGDPYAELMGSKHISVDKSRGQVPISGTAVRTDPYANWDFIEPPVRGWFAKRVCVLGAESTGTTTLAKALAEQLQTSCVEEYGREHSEVKLARNDPDWRTEEFAMIATEQTRREDVAARLANRVLICDTNAFATVLWHRRYMGSHSAQVEEIARKGRCDLYLLTGDEIPFVQDGLRDGEHIRHEMHIWFEQALRDQPAPWQVLRGSHQERMQTARRLIGDLFCNSAWHPTGLTPT
jgi:HTH-type transcriptional regulator, transcriptional repressor of NAD biosynthesis genes